MYVRARVQECLEVVFARCPLFLICISQILFFFFKVYLFLLERKIYREKENNEKDLSSTGSLPKWPEQLELS